MSFSIRNLSSSQQAVLAQLGLKAWQVHTGLPQSATGEAIATPVNTESAPASLCFSQGKTLAGTAWCLWSALPHDASEKQLLSNILTAMGGGSIETRLAPASMPALGEAVSSVFVLGLSDLYDLPLNQIHVNQQVNYVAAPALAVMLDNVDQKRRLWQLCCELLD